MNDLYLKVENVSGESKDANHLGWIDIKSYNWGVWRNSGGPGNIHYRNLTVHTTIDKSTPALLALASNGNRIKKVELSACRADEGQVENYRITLENVMLAEVSFNEKGTGTEVEYEFQADISKLQYWQKNITGGKGAEIRSGWNIKNNTSCF